MYPFYAMSLSLQYNCTLTVSRWNRSTHVLFGARPNHLPPLLLYIRPVGIGKCLCPVYMLSSWCCFHRTRGVTECHIGSAQGPEWRLLYFMLFATEIITPFTVGHSQSHKRLMTFFIMKFQTKMIRIRGKRVNSMQVHTLTLIWGQPRLVPKYRVIRLFLSSQKSHLGPNEAHWIHLLPYLHNW